MELLVQKARNEDNAADQLEMEEIENDFEEELWMMRNGFVRPDARLLAYILQVTNETKASETP